MMAANPRVPKRGKRRRNPDGVESSKIVQLQVVDPTHMLVGHMILTLSIQREMIVRLRLGFRVQQQDMTSLKGLRFLDVLRTYDSFPDKRNMLQCRSGTTQIM